MPTTAKTTAKPASEPPFSRSSLKDPTALIKAYFGAVSKLVSAQESLALRAVERAPKGIDLRSVRRKASTGE